MAFKSNKQSSATSSPAREERAAPPPAREPQREELGQLNLSVRSMNYMEIFNFTVQGKPYMEWMPRLSRNESGEVPVLSCADLDTGEECLLILPGMFNSWLRRHQPAIGTKLRLERIGKDPETGAWKLAVTRL